MRINTLSSLIFVTALGCAAAALAGACSATSRPNDFGGGGDDGEGGEGGDSSGPGGPSGPSGSGSGVGGADFTTGVGGGGSTGNDCSEAAKLIYVLSDANDLYSFEPQLKQFKKIGPLGCNTTMQPNSMAVDRNATAWVNYVQSDGFEDTAGALFKVSTADASCEPTSISLGAGWYRLGMGFSSDGPGGVDETLFIAGTSSPLSGTPSPGLGKIDFKAQAVVPIGPFSGALKDGNAELTGTGDARLFGFFTTTPVQVAEIDKASGAILNTSALSQVETPSAWAFSFWGGDFYLYTASGVSLSSNVTRYQITNQITDPAYMTNIGFRIVGAGVSTCAPVEPPK